ncbi:hypothetical protein B0H21DRAFT_749810 [Amylocystis lapponica]|nr:hypothetical protein B0H21DRAFT_749810 [Amylocystis lapponica]
MPPRTREDTEHRRNPCRATRNDRSTVLVDSHSTATHNENTVSSLTDIALPGPGSSTAEDQEGTEVAATSSHQQTGSQDALSSNQGIAGIGAHNQQPAIQHPRSPSIPLISVSTRQELRDIRSDGHTVQVPQSDLIPHHNSDSESALLDIKTADAIQIVQEIRRMRMRDGRWHSPASSEGGEPVDLLDSANVVVEDQIHGEANLPARAVSASDARGVEPGDHGDQDDLWPHHPANLNDLPQLGGIHTSRFHESPQAGISMHSDVAHRSLGGSISAVAAETGPAIALFVGLFCAIEQESFLESIMLPAPLSAISAIMMLRLLSARDTPLARAFNRLVLQPVPPAPTLYVATSAAAIPVQEDFQDFQNGFRELGRLSDIDRASEPISRTLFLSPLAPSVHPSALLVRYSIAPDLPVVVLYIYDPYFAVRPQSTVHFPPVAGPSGVTHAAPGSHSSNVVDNAILQYLETNYAPYKRRFCIDRTDDYGTAYIKLVQEREVTALLEAVGIIWPPNQRPTTASTPSGLTITWMDVCGWLGLPSSTYTGMRGYIGKLWQAQAILDNRPATNEGEQDFARWLRLALREPFEIHPPPRRSDRTALLRRTIADIGRWLQTTVPTRKHAK